MLPAFFSKLPEQKRATFVRKYIVDNDLAGEAILDKGNSISDNEDI